ncbi:biotin/lipoyl-containing protein [Salipiger abyssi]|uniref:Biotin-requiring enzyme n=1 Tax=Salipiger abyssi TaxID=1250539 RepID=A0A1P8UP35_9RHOB|nr:Biotin-requiring enzyme [Salipiger abyssi]
MATRTIKLPDVGEGVTEAELAEIQVKPGDHVREDDPVAAVMTDKATVEITSVYSGKVVWVAGEVGDTLAVGAPLLKIETDQPEADSADGDPAPEADTQAPAAAPTRSRQRRPRNPPPRRRHGPRRQAARLRRRVPKAPPFWPRPPSGRGHARAG